MAADGIHEMLINDDSIFLTRLSSVLDSEQLPFVMNPLQPVPSPVGETYPRAEHQHLHGAGHQHPAGLSQALLQATLNDVCLRLTARGEAVRYLGSAYLPGPERLLSLFEAATADVVRIVAESSQAPASDLETAVVLPPPGRPGSRHPLPADGGPWVPQM